MATSSDPDYRLTLRPIDLPDNGRVPALPIPILPVTEFDGWLSMIGATWTKVHDLNNRRVLPPADGSSASELDRAWRVWMLSHHAFFPVYALLAETYEEMANAGAAGDWRKAISLARRSADLNLAAGALLAFGIDFEPAAELYARLRSLMPPAFSGFWLREAEVLTESRGRWTGVEVIQGTEIGDAIAIERQGRNKYHAYHVEIMHRTVPNGQSLRKTYAKESGCKHEITLREFIEYDEWFRINRTAMTRPDFVVSTCGAVAATTEEIMSGSRLDEKTIRDLIVGLDAVLCVLASWFGPVPETSIHSPRSARGE